MDSMCTAITPSEARPNRQEVSEMPWSMYDTFGQRKYLTKEEMHSFVMLSTTFSIDVELFCSVVAYTGCRISEALSLGKNNIDFQQHCIVIKCLKKRKRLVFRAIPVKSNFILKLRDGLDRGLLTPDRLFPWSRMTGYRRIREVMEAAGIRGSYATPKGLRHAFGVNAVQSGVPLNMVQRWLGHADIKTTAIYTNATGVEERNLAMRMWQQS